VNLPAVPRAAHGFFEEVQLALALLDRAAPAAQPGPHPGGAQEEKEWLACRHEPAHGVARPRLLSLLGEAAFALEHRAQIAREGSVGVEVDAVGETREREPFADEQLVEEEVIETARVPHHEDHRAAALQVAQPGDGRVVEIEVAEEAPREPTEEEVEARRHRRQLLGVHLGRRHVG